MPNKTIYVPDADLTVFDHAQNVSGKNLSATIVQALRYFIKIGEGKGFEHIEVAEGEKGFYKRKRFIGRELASATVTDGGSSVTTNYTVYETVHGRFAVYKTIAKKIPFEQSIERELEKRIMEKIGAENSTAFQPGEDDEEFDVCRLEVYGALDLLSGHVPGDLVRTLHEIKDGDFLDI